MDTDDQTMDHADSQPQAAYSESSVPGQKMLDLCFVLDVTGR
jgi:hypothetical protein